MDISNSLETNAKILVLFANKYEMLDEQGVKRSGCTVHYLFWGKHGEKLEAVDTIDINLPVGVQRAKCSVDAALRVKMPYAPAIYEGSFVMSVGSDGKPVLKLVDVAFVCNVKMEEEYREGLIVPGMVRPAVETYPRSGEPLPPVEPNLPEEPVVPKGGKK